jgi:hypothetical protein
MALIFKRILITPPSERGDFSSRAGAKRVCTEAGRKFMAVPRRAVF